MAVNKRTSITDIEKKLKIFPGPYIGYIKNPSDVNRMGRLFVYIPELHGSYDETNKTIGSQTVAVNYCSPFAGQTPLSETKDGIREFANTQKSYGFWMIPPDINTKVLVMFANGDVNQGYWIGCIFEDYMNHMTPGIASSTNFVGNSEQNDRYYTDLSLDQTPVAEAQRRAETTNISRVNSKLTDDQAFRYRPVHVPSTEALIKQGLEKDTVRGTTSSSARRETPSQVFGISTPGPIDFEGQQTNVKESINRHGIIYGSENPLDNPKKIAHSRLGGHTFVMDDGTPSTRVGSKTVDAITNELIRLRTRSGAQLLLHNSENLVYITNNDGTAWIEFTADGKIDIYAKDSVSIHTENDFNLRSERDINLEAGRNVNIKATGQNTTNYLVNSESSLTTGRVRIESAANTELYIGSDGLIKAGNDVKLWSNNDFLANTGNEIHMNTDGKVDSTVLSSLSTFTNAGVNQTYSIMKRVPTAEPYAEHENQRQDKTTPAITDREKIDDREIS